MMGMMSISESDEDDDDEDSTKGIFPVPTLFAIINNLYKIITITLTLTIASRT